MKVLSFFVFLLFPLALTAQQFTVAASRMNLAYIGVSNPITVVAGSCGCDALRVTVDQGTLQNTGPCHYEYRAEKTGKVKLTVAEQRGGKLKVIDTRHLFVKYIPAPYAAVGGRKSGFFPLHLFKVQTGIMINMDNFEMDYAFTILSFIFTASRGRDLLAREEVPGFSFNTECRRTIAGLLPGDTVRLSNIKMLGADSRVLTINELVYTMR